MPKKLPEPLLRMLQPRGFSNAITTFAKLGPRQRRVTLNLMADLYEAQDKQKTMKDNGI